MGFVDTGMHRETGHHEMQKMAKTQNMLFCMPSLLQSSEHTQMPFLICFK
jgi:hypothetical protein